MAIFGFGQQDPYAEAEQAAQDRQTAFAGMRDNLPALGLIAGLSMLARNNGSRSVGQLIGQAGGDALNAYGTWRKMQDIKDRQAQLDKMAAEEREYARSQDAFKNDLAMKQFGLQEAKMAQDMAMQRQRLGMAAAELALRRQNALAGDWALSNGVLINKKTGELRQLTPEQLQQMQAAGGMGQSVDPKFSEEFMKGMGKRAVEQYGKIQDASSAAGTTLSKLDIMQKALDSDIYTGWGGDITQGTRKALLAFGLGDAEATAAAENLKTLANEMALRARNPDSGMGMPGAMSDKDREFLVEMQPSLTMSKNGNRALIEIQKRVAQRQIELARMADNYMATHNGVLDSGFNAVVRKYAEDNPMFAGIEQRYGLKKSPKNNDPGDIKWLD